MLEKQIILFCAIFFGIASLVLSVYVIIWRNDTALGLYMFLLSLLSFGCAYMLKTSFKQGLITFYGLLAIHFAGLAVLTELA